MINHNTFWGTEAPLNFSPHVFLGNDLISVSAKELRNLLSMLSCFKFFRRCTIKRPTNVRYFEVACCVSFGPSIRIHRQPQIRRNHLCSPKFSQMQCHVTPEINAYYTHTHTHTHTHSKSKSSSFARDQ
jgi:5-methylcytosine-specific restriction endonuclease McrA